MPESTGRAPATRQIQATTAASAAAHDALQWPLGKTTSGAFIEGRHGQTVAWGPFAAH